MGTGRRRGDKANESIGARIRHLRGRHMTQQELADAAEVSVDLVRKLEQGQRHTASVPYLHRIARALGTDLDGLLGQPQTVAEASVDTVGAIRDALTSIDDLLDEVDDVDTPSSRHCCALTAATAIARAGEVPADQVDAHVTALLERQRFIAIHTGRTRKASGRSVPRVGRTSDQRHRPAPTRSSTSCPSTWHRTW